jgi:hypothetical protein
MKLYHKHLLALAIVFGAWWLFLSVASGADIPKQSSLVEAHGSDITKIQLWIIGGLLSIVQTLLAYIYISGIRDLKSSMAESKKTNDEAHQELKESLLRAHVRIDDVVDVKLSKEDHDRICKSGAKK